MLNTRSASFLPMFIFCITICVADSGSVRFHSTNEASVIENEMPSGRFSVFEYSLRIVVRYRASLSCSLGLFSLEPCRTNSDGAVLGLLSTSASNNSDDVPTATFGGTAGRLDFQK